MLGYFCRLKETKQRVFERPEHDKKPGQGEWELVLTWFICSCGQTNLHLIYIFHKLIPAFVLVAYLWPISETPHCFYWRHYIVDDIGQIIQRLPSPKIPCNVSLACGIMSVYRADDKFVASHECVWMWRLLEHLDRDTDQQGRCHSRCLLVLASPSFVGIFTWAWVTTKWFWSNKSCPIVGIIWDWCSSASLCHLPFWNRRVTL